MDTYVYVPQCISQHVLVSIKEGKGYTQHVHVRIKEGKGYTL